jgi:hypothetical protein
MIEKEWDREENGKDKKHTNKIVSVQIDVEHLVIFRGKKRIRNKYHYILAYALVIMFSILRTRVYECTKPFLFF